MGQGTQTEHMSLSKYSFFSLCWSVWPATLAVCVCVCYQEYMLSLATGWTWGHLWGWDQRGSPESWSPSAVASSGNINCRKTNGIGKMKSSVNARVSFSQEENLNRGHCLLSGKSSHFSVFQSSKTVSPITDCRYFSWDPNTVHLLLATFCILSLGQKPSEAVLNT